MRLSSLLQNILPISADNDAEILGLTQDSRQVNPMIYFLLIKVEVLMVVNLSPMLLLKVRLPYLLN